MLIFAQRRSLFISWIAITLVSAVLASAQRPKAPQSAVHQKPLLIAHRGASGYAPEHTFAAYKLAMEQGADYVEQDLQVTKDGVLICLHDPDLGRTTNVEELFPNRAMIRDPEETGTPKRGWYTIDFTLEEIKRLDAGSWFNRANPFAANPSYVGQRIPTMAETITFVGKRAGLYIELKHYPYYKELGFDVASLLAKLLKAHSFNPLKQNEQVFIESFYKTGLLRMRDLAPGYARIQLLPMEDLDRRSNTTKMTAALAAEVASYAKGVGPTKSLLKSADDVVTFHKTGLLIHPYTFRGTTTANARAPLDQVQANGSTVRANIIADIQRYVGYGIDGGFTDYPALWKEAISERDR